MRLPRGPRKGRLFNQAITLCRFQDMMRGTTVEDRYHPHTGISKKVKNPLGTAKANLTHYAAVSANNSQLWPNVYTARTSIKMSLCRSTPLRILARVMAAIMRRAPTMTPCDHDSRVTWPRLVGFWPAVDSALLIVGKTVSCRIASLR